METNAGSEPLITGNVAKKEKFSEEIKEFAETAMNELLGWYGYNTTKEELKVLKRRCHSYSGSNSSGPDSPKYAEGCGWCGKPVEESSAITSGLASFCSELCFSQSRRATFKKNKTCDWCRHVRHTVSYVDFQEGASQLQFCSDKCLNQYKMHIFCRETEAHLEVHPHLPGEDKAGGSLITPDLWLKNCKSPDSRTSSPPGSPPRENHQPQLPAVPLISVAPPSKLMAISDVGTKRHRSKIQKKHRKRQAVNYNVYKTDANAELPQDLRIRQPPNEKHGESIAPPQEGLTDGSVKRRDAYPVNPHVYPNPRFYHTGTRPANPPINFGGGLIKHPAELPPVTVLVPYPIVVPFPLPIPIPIPLSGLLKREKQNEEGSNKRSVPGEDLDVETHKATASVPLNDVQTLADVAGSEEEARNGISRPLRKRKRIIDAKPRMANKKKPLAV